MTPDRVFHVVIHTPSEHFNYNIIAVNDIIVREICEDALKDECDNRGIEVPEILFCEIKFLAELTPHKKEPE